MRDFSELISVIIIALIYWSRDFSVEDDTRSVDLLTLMKTYILVLLFLACFFGRSILRDLPILSLFQKERDVFSEAWTSSVKHDGPLSKVLL